MRVSDLGGSRVIFASFLHHSSPTQCKAPSPLFCSPVKGTDQDAGRALPHGSQALDLLRMSRNLRVHYGTLGRSSEETLRSLSTKAPNDSQPPGVPNCQAPERGGGSRSRSSHQGPLPAQEWVLPTVGLRSQSGGVRSARDEHWSQGSPSLRMERGLWRVLPGKIRAR